MITIRPSSLPSWAECSRRTVARLTPHIVKGAGYTLRETVPVVGSTVGTATHAGVGHTMLNKMETGELGNQTEAEQVALESLAENAKLGVRFDETSPNLNTAEKQVLRQYRVYRIHVAPKIVPRAVEQRIEAETHKGNILSGQLDQDDGGVRDLKTGVIKRMNIAQYGGYALLEEYDTGQCDHIIEDFVQRVKIEKEQPLPIEVHYDVALAKRVAANVISDMEHKYAQFEQTGDNMIFMANPASMLCGEKFCPAFNTTWCREGRT